MASGGEDHAVSAEPQCAEDNAYSECVSYANFMSVLDDTWKRYQPLNPHDAKKGYLFKHLKTEDIKGRPILNESGTEFIRGGIVATVAAWESFVVDLFTEAFEILIKVGSGKPASIENLKKIWPGFKRLIEKERKNKKQSQLEGKSEEEYLFSHLSKMLDSKSIVPIFIATAPEAKGRFMSIDTLFVQLFLMSDDEKWPSLSQLVTELRSFNYVMRCTRSCMAEVEVKLFQDQSNASDESALKALYNISRLYYGLRCTLVHGKNKKTLEKSLNNFPESVYDFPLPTTCSHKEDIARYYIRVYEWIKKYGREVWVNYLDLLYITRFYKTAAFSLKLAVAKFLYDKFFFEADHLTTDEKRFGAMILREAIS